MNGSTLEMIAVALAIAYLLLAARESLWCWYCAFVSSAIYTSIFWDVSLLMDSLLNIFYVVMAVVGWWQWRQSRHAAEGGERPLQIHTLRLWQHGVIIGGLVLISAANGWYLSHYSSAVWPYLDSFTTWASVVTTVLLVRKVLENWIYWFVIDGISIYLYLDRELYMTALLFFAYVVLVIFGFWRWRRHYQEQLKIQEQPKTQAQPKPL